MSLLHPTPGQVFDRLAILKLKHSAYLRAKKPIDILALEMDELYKHLRDSKPGWEFAHVSLASLDRLSQVNETLWEAEDRVRNLGEDNLRELAATAKMIAGLNDERMKLVQKIDQELGWNSPVEDKIYGT